VFSYDRAMLDVIARALEELDRELEPAARRFDSGPPLAKRAIVLPSAFNPPTLAHQHLLQAAALFEGDGRAPHRDAIALLTTRNVDKGVHGASLADRIGMLLALLEEAPGIAVVASNQARIIDQAEALTRSLGLEELTFVVGIDTLERLFAPRYYTDMERELAPFFERHTVLAANRGGVSARDVERWISDNAGPFAGRVSALEIDAFPASMSSSQVREALADGDDHHALSPGVRGYILEHRLYR
jgi:nicotinamide-nucleotide adenylyltransferase